GELDPFRRARGDLLVWTRAGDQLADGALRTVVREFGHDPALEGLCGNALHLDEADELFLADHGLFDSAFWIGALPPAEVPTDFHFEIYKAPRPAVYFRRQVLEKCKAASPARSGASGQAFYRALGATCRVKKLERTLAFCRESRANYDSDR